MPALVEERLVAARKSRSNPAEELVQCEGEVGHERRPCKLRTRHVTGLCFNHRHLAHRGGCPCASRTTARWSERGCTCGVA